MKPTVGREVFEEFKNRFRQRLGRRESDNPIWDWLEKEINALAKYHDPLQDFDGDFYSELTAELRGYYWRGRDCDDGSASVRPGVKPDFARESPMVDWNCNGISGENPAGLSYEKLLCDGTDMMGVAVLGDSAAAHFALPPAWITASQINETTYSNLLSVVSNEVDWPMLSWATGFLPSSMFPENPGPVASVYQELIKRNRCNKRDFQNIGVNGCRSGAMADDVVKSLRRAPADQPLLVYLALIGDDICNPHYSDNTIAHMTTPAEFRANTLKTLEYLDGILPNGSHVYCVGEISVDIMYEVAHDLMHPIGVTYGHLFDYLNCMDSNPCSGMMNNNATLRNLTCQRGAELAAVLEDIVAKETYANFDMMYHGIPLEEALAEVKKMGLPDSALLEPGLMFHPSQLGHYLFGKFFVMDIEQRAPHWLPKTNPNNAEIEHIFGDQGGLF